jgi:biotin transport system permease protein
VISLFISSQTWLHKVPPGIKLAVLAAVSIALLPEQEPTLFVAVTALSAAGFISLGAPGLHRLNLLFKTAGLLSCLVGVIQFLFLIANLDVGAAARAALVSALRLLSLVMLADLVSVTTPISKMLRVIQTLLKPLALFGLHARKLGLSIGLMIRLAGLLRQRLDSAIQAFQIRSQRPARLRVMVPLVRQMGEANRHLAEALHARQLRSRASPPSIDAPNQ